MLQLKQNVTKLFIKFPVGPGRRKKSLSHERNKIQSITAILLDLPTYNRVLREICCSERQILMLEDSLLNQESKH